MTKRKAPNKGKKCIRKKRVNGKLKCASFGAKKTVIKRLKRKHS